MGRRGWLRVTASVVPAVLLVLGAASCADHGTGTATSTSSPVATTSAPTATTGAPPSAVPAAGTIPFIVEPPADTATTGPEGSGCAPSSATALPDGVWFGWLRAVDAGAGEVELDLACLYFHDAANAAATAAGATEVPVPDDYWVENGSPATYTLRAVPDVAVGVVPSPIEGGVVLVPDGSGLAAVARLEGRPVWLQVTDGWVVAVQEQYFP